MEKKIPEVMCNSTITSISKRKASRLDMDSQRGIFSLTIWKKILDNLLLNDLYKDIDENMSESNIGGRKKRMAKDNIFILHSVITTIKNYKITLTKEFCAQPLRLVWIIVCTKDRT